MATKSEATPQPTAKDAQRQREDEILKRMLNTPPTPHGSKKEGPHDRRLDKKKN